MVMPSCTIPLSFLNILFFVTIVERTIARHSVIYCAPNGAFECLQLSMTGRFLSASGLGFPPPAHLPVCPFSLRAGADVTLNLSFPW